MDPLALSRVARAVEVARFAPFSTLFALFRINNLCAIMNSFIDRIGMHGYALDQGLPYAKAMHGERVPPDLLL